MIINRRIPSRAITLSFAFLSIILLSGAQTSERPNILFVLTDDQGWPTLGCYGGRIVPTPNIDQLAKEGVRLTDFYVTSQCTPTRATFLTGQYTARHGLWHVLSWYGYPWARMTEPAFLENYSRDTFTVAKGLRDAGYVTGIAGKWHLTSNEDGDYTGLNPEASEYYGFDYAPPPIDRSELVEEGEDRGVDELTDQTIAFIAQNKDRPWFAFLSHHMIHGRVVAPEELTDKYRKLGFPEEGKNRAVYLAGLEHIDASMGRLLAALDELGEAEETLVIFTTDNGGIDFRFAHGNVDQQGESANFSTDLEGYDNAPLRMGKGSIYEGGIRVPFIARWPGRIPSGREIGTPAHIIDLAPTFFAAANAEAPETHVLDGENLLGLLTGDSDSELADRPVFQYYPFYDLLWGLTPSASVRRGDYKLIEFFGDRVSDDGVYYEGHTVELYNVRSDIGETVNLATASPQLVESLRKDLYGWLGDVGAAIPELNPHYDRQRRFEKTRDKPSWIRQRPDFKTRRAAQGKL